LLTNTKNGHLVVQKTTLPAGDLTSFTIAASGSGTIAGGGAGSVTDATDQNYEVTPGTYSVAETVPAGWVKTGDTCQNVVVAAGDTKTCLLTNTKDGHLIVTKVTIPAGDTTTPFGVTAGTTTGGTIFGTVSRTLVGNGGNTNYEVTPGTYRVGEPVVPTGWQQTGSTCVGVVVAAGETKNCTITNTKLGSITVEKQTNPDGAAGSFTFTGAAAGSIGDGGQIIVGNLLPGSYTSTESDPTPGFDLALIQCSDGNSTASIATRTVTFNVEAGENVKCTFTNNQRGTAKVVKTVKGAVPTGSEAFTFQLRHDATATAVGTIDETKVADAASLGNLTFSTKLVAGATYQMCEIVMPGWSTSLGSFVPGSFVPPDGLATNPAVDNSILCVSFKVDPGQTFQFTVDNTPPPGGRALTIGFWKNWASCANSGGKQKPVLDQTLVLFGTTGLVVSATSGTFPNFGPNYYFQLLGSSTTPNAAPSCSAAVNLLNKSTTDGKKKMASDPAFNLAAQLVAAELNYTAGAGKTPTATTAINQSVLLLGKYKFIGTGYTGNITAADATTMNNLATTLDNYNNDRP